jgi:predicted lipid-binding transport protein (Tim44 family)
MKNWLLGVLMVAVAGAFVPEVAEAKRFGGGMSKGMQRSAPAKPAPQQPPAPQPAQQPAPANAAVPTAATAGAAAAGKRSWLGPVAGLAAGLGLAALASHLGFGDELASFMLIALLGLGAVFLLRYFMRRNAGPTPAMAGVGGMTSPARASLAPALADVAARTPPAAFTGLQIGAGVPAAPLSAAALPADFDRPGFERIAKMIFIRMQTAHDAADLDDLRQFTTPELFADIRLDLQERGSAAQQTDVLDIDAEVQDFAEEDGRQIVSVRYTGQVREAAGAEPVPVDETWHLVRPADASRNWAIAGIQQAA